VGVGGTDADWTGVTFVYANLHVLFDKLKEKGIKLEITIF
jgi:hypothetical protein